MNNYTSTHSHNTATATLFPADTFENLSAPLRLPHISELGYWFQYLPERKRKELGLVRDEHQERGYNLVWAFKNCHADAAQHVAKLVAEELLERYDRDTLSSLVFCAVPAHTESTTRKRLDTFSAIVCRLTGMQDGTKHVHVNGYTPAKHTTGVQADRNLSADNHIFAHRDVIIFDDVTTTGHTARSFAAFVGKQHGHVIGAYYLAKTILL